MSGRIERWHHPAALEDEELMKGCRHARDRSGGPGGQHRNKVSTRVTLVHEATGVTAVAGERRSVRENLRTALRRLRLALATEVREPVPLGEIGSALWRSRLRPARGGGVGARIECNPGHRDYPALLAEALDVLEAADWDAKTAALRLDVSQSQLVKLVAEHRPAFELLNRERGRRGMRAFK